MISEYIDSCSDLFRSACSALHRSCLCLEIILWRDDNWLSRHWSVWFSPDLCVAFIGAVISLMLRTPPPFFGSVVLVVSACLLVVP